ncbi:signal recognition particle-docking protein FtsY [Caballeronia udeis]|uniref:Signal recognition particle receptor FtsY n=1 Tax=Caballeronia udeis TaxID=1232866 RepID=A0A158IBS8_9BURK|nr:signal recognition particle-docking protein FtsY [Caballeronia udeis]SAL54072.1 signal recognition particle-docking protein FtsY [Caballeronia udeis]
MFSFFKRLVGKSTDTDTATDTDKPEENEAEDAAEARSEGAEALRPASTPVTPAQPVETAREGAATAYRDSGSSVDASALAPRGPDAPASRTQAAAAGHSGSGLVSSADSAQGALGDSGPPAAPTTLTPPASPTAPASVAQADTSATTPAAPAQQPPASALEAKPYWQGRTVSQWKAPAETVEIVPPPEPEPSAKRSWLTRLKTGLSKTSSGLTGIFIGAKIDEDLYEELETALLMSDAGVDATEYLLEALREKVRSERLTDSMQVKAALRSLLAELLRPLEKSLMLGRAKPLVMMIAGVNGAGKTTSIGKLAKHLQRFDQSVLLAAGDTFRAAAREQLTVWGQRNNVTVVSQESGDAAAVIFDAVGAARARKIDVMMADTAGRLPTQLHLMEELRKVKRVIAKAQPDAPHEVLLVIDANTGQNALAQVKSFDDALGLTGLIVTKLDGTAKGGILAAIARQRPIPVYFIGVGEKVEDLQPFSADEFADALLGS